MTYGDIHKAEMTENECINERHPLVKGDNLTHCLVTAKWC